MANNMVLLDIKYGQLNPGKYWILNTKSRIQLNMAN